jgi:hypothetical protein
MPDGNLRPPFSSENQPERRGDGGSATKRANASVKHALMQAFDTLGNHAFFVALGKGSAEDRRCLAMILAKLLPIEVAGTLDATLTVKVVTQLGDQEIEVKRPSNLPLRANSQSPTPVLRLQARAGEDPPSG